MRFSKFYTFLIFFVAIQSWGASYRRTQGNLGVVNLSPIQFAGKIDLNAFDLKIEMMKKQIVSLKSPAERLDFVRKVLTEIQKSRSVYPMLEDDVEIYMNLIIHSVDDLPARAQFNPIYCPYYKKQMMSNYEPTALGEMGEIGTPVDPAIVQALDIINKICQ